MTTKKDDGPCKGQRAGSAYSRNTLAWVKREGMKIDGARSVRHIYPRAYCIAKPAPLCAVFVTPWMDAEPQIRNKQYSASTTVHEGVADVEIGDWCALAYVVTDGCSQTVAFRLPNDMVTGAERKRK